MRNSIQDSTRVESSKLSDTERQIEIKNKKARTFPAHIPLPFGIDSRFQILIPDRSVFSVLCDKKLFLSRVSFPASSVPPQFRLSFAFFCYKLMNTDVANSGKGLCLLNISYITYYIIHNNIKQFKNWKIDKSPYRLL